MSFNLTEAKRSIAKLRLAIAGAAGSGKTYSALLIAYGLCGDWSKIAVIDTERGSANLYEHLCQGGKKYFTGQLNAPFTPKKYIDAIHACEEAGMEVIIIDSLSHAWYAEGGMLDIHSEITRRQTTQNSFTAWREITPLHNKLVDAILTSPVHVIVTLRTQTEYVLETDARGKQVPKKVGMKPIFRQGIDYEMTLVFDLDATHTATITKSRSTEFPVGDQIIPDVETGKKLLAWLNSGADIPKCADCGEDIQPYGKMSALQVAYETERKYGRQLCAKCGAKAKELMYGEISTKKPIPDPLAGGEER